MAKLCFFPSLSIVSPPFPTLAKPPTGFQSNRMPEGKLVLWASMNSFGLIGVTLWFTLRGD